MNSTEPKHFPTFYELNRTETESFYINEVENAIDSIETAVSFLGRPDTLKWKWISLALHHALHSFCISALTGSNYDRVLAVSNDADNHHFFKRNESDKWKKSHRVCRPGSPAYTITWTETDEEPGKSTVAAKPKKLQLIGFWIALARIQDQEFWMISSRALSLTEAEWRSIEMITLEVRNDLTHFVPISRSFDVASIKDACKDVLRAIEFIALESRAIVFIHRKEARQRIIAALSSLRAGFQG